jgi:hypothetical protein
MQGEMTPAAGTGKTGWAQAPNAPAPMTRAMVLIGLGALWFVLRPYEGIIKDAYLYVGRALADLDPNGVGQDWMFRNDQQMRYSVFPIALRLLVRWLGPNLASETVAFLALSVWFASFVSLANALESGRQKWLLIFFTVLARPQYSPFFFFTAEAQAVARPFAEAFVLFAMACMIRGRNLPALALLILAAGFNPIMALAGVGVFFVVKSWEDRRWLIVAGMAAAGAALAAILKIPVADRLFLRIDHDWRSALDPLIFVRNWDVKTFGSLTTALSTIALAARRLEGRRRKFLVATVAVGLAGLAGAAFLGDRLSNLLVLQLQTWRAGWLAAALAPAALAVLALDARKRPAVHWLAPSLMAMAWTPIGGAQKILCSALAILIFAAAERGKISLSDSFSRKLAFAVLAYSAVVSSYRLGEAVALFASAFRTASALTVNPLGLPAFLTSRIAPFNDQFWPLAAIGALFAFGVLRSNDKLKAVFALGALALALSSWDARTGYRRSLDEAIHVPDFATILSERPGEVYWSRGANEAWNWLGRPNWLADLQQWPILLSREQAMIWKARNERALALGLKQRQKSDPEPMLTMTQLATFCAGADAPAWIVWPLKSSEAPPPDLSPRAIWRAPDLLVLGFKEDGSTIWTKSDRFMLLPCGGGARA